MSWRMDANWTGLLVNVTTTMLVRPHSKFAISIANYSHWSLSWMQRIQGVSCQFPPLLLDSTNASVGLRHVVTLTLKQCAHLCWATKRMTCVTGKIEGAKVADGGGRRGPMESKRLGRGQKCVLFIGFSTSQHAPGLSISLYLARQTDG